MWGWEPRTAGSVAGGVAPAAVVFVAAVSARVSGWAAASSGSASGWVVEKRAAGWSGWVSGWVSGTAGAGAGAEVASTAGESAR
ncbi:hypothetical protein AQJ84_22590 [Streptomyces resistomycificus]|nr:hypothetical protein AQJ84_22590 [Streptomyces resistomycificus]